MRVWGAGGGACGVVRVCVPLSIVAAAELTELAPQDVATFPVAADVTAYSQGLYNMVRASAARVLGAVPPQRSD